MIVFLYAIIYIIVFHYLKLPINFYVFSGVGLLTLFKAFQGKNVRLLGYLKMFEIKLTKDNYAALCATILYFSYYYYRIGALLQGSSIISLPTFVVYFFYLMVDYD